jgi:pSer/pThr/pTyr-binding forkhead associated (FHA) protein/DNA-directed RNA polymerase subunit RPC12/RpoP
MDIEIKIGREVDGACVYRVPSSFQKVSRHHASLYYHGGLVTLEDRSSNGTYVNGQRITRTTISENDIVWLGGDPRIDTQCCQLDLRALFASYGIQCSSYSRQAMAVNNGPAMAGNTQRTDYSMEFERLKNTYINYHEELSKVTKKATMKMQLPRILLSMIPAIIGLVVMIIAKDMTIRIVAMSAGSVLSGLIGTLTMGRNSSKKEKLTEDTLDLQLKYQKDYKCPKCGKEFNLDMHWKKLKADGKCPYGCGAQF